jgi:ribosomal-protein-alanine acetyltransferase
MPDIQRGQESDLTGIDAIQSASPEASHWKAAEYFDYDLRVATVDGEVAGFLAGRSLGEGEYEILNLAVAPAMRRRGVARSLIDNLLHGFSGTVFLEVRASNLPAIALYKRQGFQELSRRDNYYPNPPEAAIVMKFHSC